MWPHCHIQGLTHSRVFLVILILKVYVCRTKTGQSVRIIKIILFSKKCGWHWFLFLISSSSEAGLKSLDNLMASLLSENRRSISKYPYQISHWFKKFFYFLKTFFVNSINGAGIPKDTCCSACINNPLDTCCSACISNVRLKDNEPVLLITAV